MPTMDGAEFLSRVRELAPEVPRILLTGEAGFEGIVAAVNRGGITSFLAKPCTPERLTRALDEAIRAASDRQSKQAALELKVQTLESNLVRASQLATAGTLVGGVAHELNNVLAAHTQALATVRERTEQGLVSDPEDVQVLATVERHLIAQVKDLQRLGRPEGPGEAPRTDLALAVSESLALLAASGALRRVKIDVSLSDTPVWIRMKSTRIDQVVVNLVKNAVDATEGIEGRERTVRVTVAEDEGIGILRVEDNGCGIPAKDLAAIFDPYVTTKAPGNGTGLGLYVVKRIAEAAGGKVTANSTVGRGSRMDVSIPVLEGTG